MRVFLRSGRTTESFAEVLENIFRAAGFGATRRDAAAKAAASAASYMHEPDERHKAWAPPTSLIGYLEQREAARKRAAKPADPQSIARELALTPRMSPAELTRVRRQFALANHPDRVAATDRDNATRRMMIANMLIDHELQRKLSRRFSPR